ncbi:MAG: tyrosine-type recombinase/integrase [Chloroflexota bacterium]|nr:tyrosine-type recombinase/integrase [Chloroflexota bacterium]MDE2946021.1 tyrosine-type recombinase/integrase [Chloroflexota bacterium]
MAVHTIITGMDKTKQERPKGAHETRSKLWRDNYAILMPDAPNKDQKSRLGFYIDWLSEQGRAWYQPDLGAYRDYLLFRRARLDRQGKSKPATLSPQTTLAHLATIRGRYSQLTRSNDVRDLLFELANPEDSEAEQRALVDEFFIRMMNDLHPASAPVKLVEAQDIADSEHLRLKPYQVSALVQAPGITSLRGLRDTALMTLMVCSGIRAAEAAALRVDDLRQHLGGELSLRVREGKGNKQRLIPYGPLDWCLMYVDAWLREAGIKAGPVFRGIRRGGVTVRGEGIGAWTVNDIMNSYPISIDGALRLVKPHDLRRTYARNAYDFGMDLERIRQNLGHTSLQTTQTYIGALDGRDRHPPNMFSPPHDAQSLALLTGAAIA